MGKIILLLIVLIGVASPFAYNYYNEIKQENTVADLEGPDRRCVGCDLSGMDLSYRDFRGYDFTNANMTKVDMRCTNLSYANLSGVIMRGANISGAILTGARLGRSTIMERVIWDDGSVCNYSLVR